MEDYQFIDGTRLSSVIESLIFASPEPIPGQKLCEIIAEGDEQLHLDESAIKSFVDKLNERYEENAMSFRVVEMGGGYTFATEKKFHLWLSIYQHQNAYRRLSQSAIETLAIVACRQPITKPEIDQIRGVDSGYILRQLMEKMLVQVAGRADSPGKPLLYKTTRYFLQHFGINSVDELPKPREIEEILKDDDMAEHRQLLIERQMQMLAEDAPEEESTDENAETVSEELSAENENEENEENTAETELTDSDISDSEEE